VAATRGRAADGHSFPEATTPEARAFRRHLRQRRRRMRLPPRRAPEPTRAAAFS